MCRAMKSMDLFSNAGFTFAAMKRTSGKSETHGPSWQLTKLVPAHHLGKRTVSGAAQFMRKLASAALCDTEIPVNHRWPQRLFLGYWQCSWTPRRACGLRAIGVGNSRGSTALCSSPPSRGDPHADLWRPRRLQNLHFAPGTAEPHHAYVYAEADSLDKLFLKEMVAWYNFCRKHMSLNGRTLAMAAGIENHVWSVTELMA